MRTLYQFPLSHFCEKARWLLDYKELDYVAKNLIPGMHRPYARLKTSKDTLPMLHDGNVWIADSTEIALYLDGMYPEQAFLRREPALRSAAIELDKVAHEMGVHVRRWVFLYMLNQPETMDIMLGESGFLRTTKRFSVPVLKHGVKKIYGIYPNKAQLSKQKLDMLIDTVEQQLIANGGRYLVGDRLGLADISVCSMTAPLVGAYGTPWEMKAADIERLPEPIRAYRAQLLDRPFGQYVLRLYDNERNARVDWKGI